MSHLSRQLAQAVSKTAQKPEDGWTDADVKDLNMWVGKMKASKRIPMFRSVRLVKLVVLTAFDAHFAKDLTAESGLITTITACGVENEQTVFTMVEFNRTVIHRVIGSMQAAESAVLATALDRLLFLLELILCGEPQGGTDWRSRLRIHESW